MLTDLEENIEIMLPKDGLKSKLQQSKETGRPLIIKLGFDPTAPDLHLGHAVVLKKLKQFQELGHQIVVLVGSFTARIGDPTGKNKARKPLNQEKIADNAATYIAQLAKIIDMSKTKVVFNGDWLDKLDFSEVIQLVSKVTVAQLMQRHDFHKRFTENQPIAMHELIYPILQGYDSVHIRSDIEMGGTDQLFNCTMGRQLQESFGMDPQVVLCMPLLRGLDGKEKMSKSLHNTIGLLDEPNEMFGKAMSIPDSLIPDYIDLTTDFTAAEKKMLKSRMEMGENPMEVKKLIAHNLVCQYHDQQAAMDAADFFAKQFQRKSFDDKSFVEVSLPLAKTQLGPVTKLVDLCHFLKKDQSKSAVRRLISEGAVQIDSTKCLDPDLPIDLTTGFRIKLGKRSFFRFV
ncbi:tyrosine--tRNA ligase [Sphingobacterium sp. DR205]|uniref:tyrosine--tRNA ligase n=1 Tax=Sphingobacterium sp. DR205 TaxID=2713573 RepID=UPI0013E4A977|nr:tyrosine--tRNA ligase [Sphingobacterium sp. DR205]QIH35163.1 tyrosine--tRNA ligase [Sphingobacterium sp. DR205]